MTLHIQELSHSARSFSGLQHGAAGNRRIEAKREFTDVCRTFGD